MTLSFCLVSRQKGIASLTVAIGCAMTRFSLPVLVSKALSGNKTWEPQWPDAEPKAEYDVVIVGAGGHGLGAAYYLAKEHGVTRVAVIDKGWLGGGNTGRNTTIIRSNYLYDESARLYEHAIDRKSTRLNSSHQKISY